MQIPIATLTCHFLHLVGLRKKYRICGHSMYPLLRNGSAVFVKKNRNYNVGDTVVAEHPFRNMLVVKMIHKIRSNACEANDYYLRGFDPIESEDSRSFGAIPAGAIEGKVVAVQ